MRTITKNPEFGDDWFESYKKIKKSNYLIPRKGQNSVVIQR